MRLTYDFIMESIDKVVRTFEDGTENHNICRSKLISNGEGSVYIENEVESLLDNFNVQNNVEVITDEYPGAQSGVLCISFFYEGNLGTYNIFVYDY